MTEIRSVIVADPNTIMLQALSDLFERDKRFSLVATSKTAEGFLESCLRVPVDIGIVDWTIPQLGAERLLGIPIPPPPPDIPAVEPDIRGAKTLREQLALHSSQGSCAACHAKFDPYGFALESFDVTGAFRKNYRVLNPERKSGPWWTDGLAVDCSGMTCWPEGKWGLNSKTAPSFGKRIRKSPSGTVAPRRLCGLAHHAAYSAGRIRTPLR